jgi:hypothetical protein
MAISTREGTVLPVSEPRCTRKREGEHLAPIFAFGSGNFLFAIACSPAKRIHIILNDATTTTDNGRRRSMAEVYVLVVHPRGVAAPTVGLRAFLPGGFRSKTVKMGAIMGG